MKIRLSLILVATILLSSCGGSKKIAENAESNTDSKTVSKARKARKNSEPKKEEAIVIKPLPADDTGNYIKEFAEIAQEEMRLYSIPASITLAQGILESGAGKGELVGKAKNHFGIKCHDWKGAVVYHDDDEQGECFRKYSLAKFSYRDHSLFLSNRGRYSSLFKLPKDDYKGWANGLKNAGYATDPAYPDKLIRIVEKYQLYRYDGEVLGKSEKDYAKVVDKKNRHTVEKGETLYALSKKYDISIEDLMKINGLENDAIFEGQVLYIQPYNRGY